MAHERGFKPACIVFDSWYSGSDTLKQIRGWGWTGLTRLKANWLVNPDRTGLRSVASVELPPQGAVVYLKGYGLIRLFLIVDSNGDREYWATNDLTMTPLMQVCFADYAWTIETYHRGIRQYCGVERAQVRAASTA